jgi:hypothetical protein
VSTTRRYPVVVVGVLAAAAALLILAVALLGNDDEVASRAAGTAAAAPATVALEGDCASVHAGHAVMSWNPVMADEMLDAGCPWPYPPFDVAAVADGTGGGARAVDTPFEAHHYAELWSMIGALGLGTCEVRAVPDPPTDGFAFGFVYLVSDPGCDTAVQPSELVAREYIAAGVRDAAAHERPGSLVLGRWVLEVSGEPERAALVREGLVWLGAVEP